jgi:DNA-binding beta-propeller fold protein YncE
LAVLLTIACLLAMLGAADARAATNYASAGAFAGTSFNGPTRVAVDDATGNVLVVDSGNNQIQVFGPGGVSATQLTTFGSGELSAPYGIAIDQTSHAVYVSDAGNNRIARYTTDGLPTPTYTLDITYSGPLAGAGSGQVGSFASPIALDPNNGNLLVADTGNLRVSRFTSSGAFVGSFTGADTAAGSFKLLLDIGVGASGDAYVIDFDTVFPYPDAYGQLLGTSRVEHFDATGASLGRLGGPDVAAARSVTVDADADNVIVANQGPFGDISTLKVFHDGLPLSDIPYPAETSSAPPVGLAVDGGSSGRLYGLTTAVANGSYALSSVQVFDPVPLPDLVLDPPSSITKTTAHLSGTVDPLGTSADYRFEYSSDGSNWTSTADEDAGSGSGPAPVSAELVDLVPKTTYKVRLRGTNANGTMATLPRSFTTLVSAPAVTTDPATDRTTTGATLRGFVTPYGLQTTYHFEYGPTAAYGSRAPVSSERTAGDGYRPRHAQYSVSGLQAGQTYHYRLVARNSAGETAGPDRTFATAAGPDNGRVYEMVSPVDKGGANVQTVQAFHASLDGNRLAYFTTTAIPGLSEAAPGFARYSATRDAEGWLTRATDPPQLKEDSLGANNATNTIAISEDGTKALVVSLKKLAAGANEGDSNIYVKDLTSGTYVTAATASGTTVYKIARDPVSFGGGPFIDGTPDFSHLALYSSEPFLPGAPANAVYEFSDGKLRLASRAPDGTPVAIQSGGDFLGHDLHYISEDGSRIFMAGSASPVYVRLDGTTTVVASASERAGDGGAVRPADFLGASADGRFAFIFAQDLTDDSSPGARNLYRYDVDARQLTLLVANVDRTSSARRFEVSSDGTTFYFLSSEVLAPGAILTQGNMYVWRAGQGVALIATLDSSLPETLPYSWRASPNGRYFAFAAHSRLTEYDNSSATACPQGIEGEPGGACREIYRYDANTGTLTCVSCRRDGARSIGNARIGTEKPDIGGPYYARAVLDDGRVFFDTPNPIAASDTNSKRDVYEFDGTDATLITTGHGTDSRMVAVSADGRDVFFTTQDQLVSQDKDTLTDVYDARIGGGIDGENATRPDLTCSGEDCRGATPGPRAPDEPPSQRVAGAHAPRAAPAKATVTITSAKFAGTVLKLSVQVSGAGRVRASGAKVVAVTRTASKSGRYALKLPMTKKQRALRRAGRKVRTAITVSFTPVYGQRATRHITRTAAR